MPGVKSHNRELEAPVIIIAQLSGALTDHSKQQHDIVLSPYNYLFEQSVGEVSISETLISVLYL